MQRNKKTRLRRLSLLPRRKLKAPSSPREAKEYLKEVADHLSSLPNASNSLRFVALAIRKFLRGKVRLTHALGLVLPTASKRGRPSLDLEKIRVISKMLTEKTAVPVIGKTVRVSEESVKRVRADRRAVTLDAPLSKLDHGEELHGIELEDAEARIRKIPEARRTAILLGIADAIPANEIIPPLSEAERSSKGGRPGTAD